jgi:outer membrane protein assembly factor BamB
MPLSENAGMMRHDVAMRLGLRLLWCCLALATALPASAEPVFKTVYRVRVSDRGLFALGPLETATPAVSRDGFNVLIGGGSGRLLVLDAASGEISFEIELDGGVSATPLVLEDRFVVGTDNGSIYLVANDGRLLWPQPARIKGAVRGKPALWHDSVLIVGDDTSSLHAISLADGTLLASFSAQSFARRGLSPFTVFGYPDPMVDGDLVVAGFETGFVSALKPKGGDASPSISTFETAWQNGLCSAGELSRATAASGQPLCSPRRVFRDADTSPTLTPAGLVTGCYCRGLVLLDPATGTVRWETPILGPSAPAVANERLYVLSADDRLRALDQATGKVVWTTGIEVAQVLTPVLAGSAQDPSSALLVVATGGPVYLVWASTGRIAGRIDVKGGVAAPPLVVGRSLFLVAAEGFLYRIDVFP